MMTDTGWAEFGPVRLVLADTAHAAERMLRCTDEHTACQHTTAYWTHELLMLSTYTQTHTHVSLSALKLKVKLGYIIVRSKA